MFNTNTLRPLINGILLNVCNLQTIPAQGVQLNVCNLQTIPAQGVQLNVCQKKEKLEDTKEVIRIRMLKYDRQYNDKKIPKR